MRALYMAYTFPPVSTGSAPMNLKVTGLLAENGWKTTVVTPEYAGGLPRDDSLLNLLHRDVEVVRRGSVMAGSRRSAADSPGPWRRSAPRRILRRFLLETCLQPDRYAVWIPPAVFASLKALRSRKHDLILSLGPPHSVHLSGMICSVLTGLPWVAWFGDLWLNDGFTVWESLSPARRYWSRVMERLVVRRCDGILTTTEGSSRYFTKAYPGFCPPVHTQWNGATREEIRNNWNPEPPAFTGERLVVTYTGYFMGTQTPEHFLRGMKLFMERNPGRKVLFRMIGDPGTYAGLPGELGMGDSVEFHGIVPYSEVFRWQRSSDLLLLMTPPMSGNELKNSSKTVECLLARKPVLVVAPEGDMTGLIRRMNAGYVCGHDPGSICEALETAWREMTGGVFRVLPDRTALEGGEMDMEMQVRLTAQFFESLARRS